MLGWSWDFESHLPRLAEILRKQDGGEHDLLHERFEGNQNRGDDEEEWKRTIEKEFIPASPSNPGSRFLHIATGGFPET